MASYILIASPINLYPGHVKGIKIFRHRLERGIWPFNENTRNKKSLEEGDSLLFYISGREEESHMFWAQGIAATKVKTIKIDEPEHWHIQYPRFGLKLGDIKEFQKPVPIREILTDLSFIKSYHKWGAYLQGGCITIEKKDYELVVNCHNARRTKAKS
jgi:predicted RNA-binding protein